MLISTIDYSEYVGRIGVGRITRGVFKAGMNVVHTNVQTGVTSQPWRLGNLYQYDGLKRVDAEEVRMGDIVALSGAADLSIGDTVCAPECIEGLPFVKISEPTVTMHVPSQPIPPSRVVRALMSRAVTCARADARIADGRFSARQRHR